MVRQHNEDACLSRPDLGIWVVADGMGGHSAGDLASSMIVDRLGELDFQADLSAAVDDIDTVLEEVNTQLRTLAESRDGSTIGSTVAVLLVRGSHAICLWSGDSRIYRVRDAQLSQLTQDHALVADLVERGVLTAEQAENHPQSNLVTRAIGAADALKLDLEIYPVSAGDQYILCSDGLDKELSDNEIRDIVIDTHADELANTLVELALSRGSRDNVTVVAVTVHGNDANLRSAADPHQDFALSDEWPPDATQGDHDAADSEDTVPGFTTGQKGKL